MPRNTNKIVETARDYLGYTARGNNSNTFSISAGLTGEYFPWDGAFVDRVLAESGVQGYPAHGNTAAALSFYLDSWLVRTNPQAGDLVFYAFQTASGTASFDSPHIGVVTDVSRWKKDQSFRAVEGQVNSGQPKAPKEANGVYERTRFKADVLCFVRIKPVKHVKRPAKQKESITVRPAALTRCTSAQQAASARPELRREVEAVQLALASHPFIKLRNANRGVYDAKTRSAAAAFQRFIGKRTDECTGWLTVEDLETLGNSGEFFTASE